MAKKLNLTDLQCKDTVYITPDEILDPVRAYFDGPIPLDPATQPDNPTKAVSFATGSSTDPGSLGDGLSVCWADHGKVFVNPPYGKGMKHWCEKICTETVLGAEIIALLPCGARFGTRYWQNFIFNPGLDATMFYKGRVSFLRPDGTAATQNPYDSQILLFNGDIERFAEKFKHLGKVVKMEVM